MARRCESRETWSHADKKTGGHDQHQPWPFIFRADRGQLRQPIPAQCRDQKPEQGARGVEGTGRGAAQEERGHGDSESGLAVNQPGKLDGDSRVSSRLEANPGTAGS
jgi:hypothetical protein